jgi:tetratricopeptide (TPR) repeat protein
MKSRLEILRGDPTAALTSAKALEGLAQEHGLPSWRTLAELSAGWARGRLHDTATGAEELSRALADRIEQGALTDAWFFNGLLAELEGETLGAQGALARIDEAMALARQVETRCNLPFLHLLRGKLLLERPSNPAPAVEAFQTALEIAKEQGARSWGLRAALSLAKHYQSTARPVDAHAVLAPALEGFAPTPEMPEIAEAEALLAALAASEPVAAELRRRETRSKLHAGYALATMMTKGFGAEETKAALARAASVSEAARTPEYWTVVYGRINADMMGGDLRSARAGVEAFLAEAEAAGLPGQAAFARRMLGFLKLLAGDVAGARVDLERALAGYDERRDESLRTVFALDLRSNALAYLGLAAWHLGDFEEAERLTNEALRRAKDSGQPGSYAIALVNRFSIDAACGRAKEVLPAAEEMRTLAEQHELKFWRATAATYADWARVRLGEQRAEAFRAGLAAYADLGARMSEAWLLPLLAEVELAVGRRDEALEAVERGLALQAETGVGLMQPWLLRLRGDALAETDPAGAASAYREALSVAGAQGSRALALMAALSLAKLLKSTGEAVDAHDALSDALKGFAPTPEMPEIAEAQALLEGLAHGGEGAISKDEAT